MKDGSIYRVDPSNENDFVERESSKGWEKTSIKWKDFDWGDEYSIGLGSGDLKRCRNYWSNNNDDKIIKK